MAETWSLPADCARCGYPISTAGAQAFRDVREQARKVSRLAGRKGILTGAELAAVHEHANRLEREAAQEHRRTCPDYAALRDRMEGNSVRLASRREHAPVAHGEVPTKAREAERDSDIGPAEVAA